MKYRQADAATISLNPIQTEVEKQVGRGHTKITEA
jgi:hypothetical protein